MASDHDALVEIAAIVETQLHPPAPSTTVIPVPAGTSLQTAYDAAPAGARLELEGGASYDDFVARPKEGAHPTNRVLVTTRDWQDCGPGMAGLRAVYDQRGGMATIRPRDRVGYGIDVPNADDGRGGFLDLVGVALGAVGPSGAGVCVRIGDGQESDPSRMAQHVSLRQVYLTGDPVFGTKRGIEQNGADVAIAQVWVDECFRTGAGIQDSQGLGSTVGKRTTVQCCYLAGGSENFMIGGDWIRGAGMVPEDWLVEDVICHKPLRWLAEYHAAGTRRMVKNLLELKHGRRITLRRILLVNNWGGALTENAQDGRGILLNYSTNGACGFCGGLEDVTLEDFALLNSPGGINLQGYSHQPGSANAARLLRVAVRHGFYHAHGGTGLPLAVSNVRGRHDLTFDRLTIISRATKFLVGDLGWAWTGDPPLRVRGGPMQGLALTDSLISQSGTYGVTVGSQHDATGLRAFVDADLEVRGNVIGQATSRLLAQLNAPGVGSLNVAGERTAIEAQGHPDAYAPPVGTGADPGRITPLLDWRRYLPEP